MFQLYCGGQFFVVFFVCVCVEETRAPGENHAIEYEDTHHDIARVNNAGGGTTIQKPSA